ncbi:ATP-binding protein [Streptomyces sp. NPDC048663]|uniref:ATP-binding protein n=1 Tax=Streptomyces sp. NPDC048663 TaxID=3155638 RepID=UPI00344938E3
MSRILSFEITGLAGRNEPLRRELNSGVNIFWGKNGCGKTSMLKILHSALLDDAAFLARVPFTTAKVHIETPLGRLERRIWNPEVGEPREDEDNPFIDEEWQEYRARERLLRQADQLHWSTTPSNIRMPRGVRHSYLSTLRLSDTPRVRQGISSSEVLDEAAFDRLFARQIRIIWQDYYTRELMQIRRAQQKGLAAIATSVMLGSSKKRRKTPSIEIGEFDAEAAYGAVREFFDAQEFELRLTYGEFVENFETSTLMREVVAEVIDVQRGIEAAQEPTAALQELVKDLFSGGKHLEFEGRTLHVKQGSTEIPLWALSSGEKQVIRLLIECLAAGGNPVLIDEPELSMHVDWQHRLVECMRLLNPRAQLILATHSPEIMADVTDEEIMEL